MSSAATRMLKDMMSKGDGAGDRAQAFNLAFIVPVACLVLLPIGLPLIILTFVAILPLIPVAFLVCDDPPRFIQGVLSWPVKALMGVIQAIVERGGGEVEKKLH